MQEIIMGTVCTGIGAPEVAIEELAEENNFIVKNVFACEKDKYARASYLANFTPNEMFEDMTSDYFHIYAPHCNLFIGGIPCQAFSIAGKRLGELDKRGLLFYDFYEYVRSKQPRVFLIENVKDLLSDNNGKTFQNWCALLGRSLNQHEQMFLHPDCLEYNLHHTVLNSKDFGVPQNRERVFIVGIRKDLRNDFRFPVGFPLTVKLKDILEPVVDEKYYLSEKMLQCLTNHNENQSKKGNKFSSSFLSPEDIHGAIKANYYKMPGDSDFLKEEIKDPAAGRIVGRNPENPKSRVAGIEQQQTLEINKNSVITNVITTVQKDNVIVEPTFLNGSEIGNTIRTGGRGSLTAKHNWDAVIVPELKEIGQIYDYDAEAGRIYDSEGLAKTIKNGGGGGSKTGLYLIDEGDSIEHRGHVNKQPNIIKNGIVPTLRAESHGHETKVVQRFRIRRLTPLECWRLQAFPDENFYKAKEVNSDTQLYKQAGNSMTTSVMKAIIKNLLHILLN